MSVLLPLAELTVAGALIPARTAWIGSLGALVLLGIFILAIGANLARGRKPDCNCFGQIASGPIGTATLARNAAFSIVGLFIAIAGHQDAGLNFVDWLSPLNGAERVGLVAAIALALATGVLWRLLFQLMRQNGRLLVRIGELEQRGMSQQRPSLPESPFGPAVGTPAPPFSLPSIQGGTGSLETLLAARKPVLLVFTSPDCAACKELQFELTRQKSRFGQQFTMAFISTGDVDFNRQKLNMISSPTVLVQQEIEVFEAYGIPGTPSAVLVAPDGNIASSVFAGPQDIHAFLDFLTAPAATGVPLLDELPAVASQPNGNGHRHTAALSLGDSVPPIQLENLAGDIVDLGQITLGSKTTLIFWNTSCGFCRQMIPEVQAWDRETLDSGQRLVLVSAGSAEELRALDLESPVLLDPNFAVAQHFGAQGTPMAVQIDESGRVASRLAAGAPDILASHRIQREAGRPA